MNKIKAIMFDLDDTLLDRRTAADAMFYVIAEKCYAGAATDEMKRFFIKHDNNGYASKIDVLNALFDEFPPVFRISGDEIYPFWNAHFPRCFSMDAGVLETVKKIKAAVKSAIITNGHIEGQGLKIEKTGLDKIFAEGEIIISEAAGAWKPDPRIYEIALERLGAAPEEALYVGDHLHKDIGGCQGLGIRGVWFNPLGRENDTGIKPFMEIKSFDELLNLIA